MIGWSPFNFVTYLCGSLKSKIFIIEHYEDKTCFFENCLAIEIERLTFTPSHESMIQYNIPQLYCWNFYACNLSCFYMYRTMMLKSDMKLKKKLQQCISTKAKMSILFDIEGYSNCTISRNISKVQHTL